MSRWVRILATTPSGKAQFICRFCGRKSIAPDKRCTELPNLSTGGLGIHKDAGLTCEQLEAEMMRKEKDAAYAISWNAIPKAETIAQRVRQCLDEEYAVSIIQKDRAIVTKYLGTIARKVSDRVRSGDVTAAVRLENALRYAVEEIEKK